MADPLETARLALPYLAASQAQKHVTHNEALRRLDFLVQPAVLSTGATTPPSTPAEGDLYLLGAGATGDWAGQDGSLAAFADGFWQFATPALGWVVFDIATDTLQVKKAAGWVSV